MVQSLTVSGTFNVFTDICVEALSQAVTNDGTGSVEAIGLEMQLDFRRKQNESLMNYVV